MRWATVFAVMAIAGGIALPAHAQAARPPVPVEGYTVTLEDGAQLTETFAGLATARRSSPLGFESGGRLAAVSADVGDRVEEGEVIAALDLRTLDAQIAAAAASVKEAEASEALAQVTLDRQIELLQKGHVADQVVDEAEASRDVASARVAAAKAQARQLRVRRDLAQITAPYDGVVTERHFDEGSIVGAGAPVLRLVEDDAVEMRVGVPLAQADTLTTGEVADFRVGDRRVQGRLRALTGVVDAQARTVDAVFDPVGEAVVAPGEVVRLERQVTAPGAGFWAPITALTQARRGLWTVYVVPGSGDQGALEARIVDVLYVEADWAFIRGALDDGERIVASGLERVVPGQLVAIVREAPAYAELAQR